MSMPFRLRLPRHLYQAMIDQARAEFPLECCGLLAGTLVTSGTTSVVGQVTQRYPLINSARSAVLFESDPRSMFDATRAIDSRGLEVLAVYHSHPSSAPIPSKTDLARNYWPSAATIIIGLVQEEADVRAWWLAEESFREAEWEVVESS